MLAQDLLDNIALSQPPTALVGSPDVVNVAFQHGVQIIKRNWQQCGAHEAPHQRRDVPRLGDRGG